jgi:integrase
MIHVHVIKRSDRKNYLLAFVDPVTMRKKQITTGTNKRREAEKQAIELEDRLNNRNTQDEGLIDIGSLYFAYYDANKHEISQKSFNKISTAIMHVDRILPYARSIRDYGRANLNEFKEKLIAEKRPIATVKSIMGSLRILLNWAYTTGKMKDKPIFPVIKSPPGFKGRNDPVTEEFYRELLDHFVDSNKLVWIFQGLWNSDLRLQDLFNLTWHDSPVCVIWFEDTPLIKFDAESDKNKQAKFHPISPEFCQLLRDRRQDSGKVFPLHGERGQIQHHDTYGDIIRQACRTVWGDRPGKPPTAHSFRRAYGERWAMRVNPTVLTKLMRHADISTTLGYYAKLEALTVMKHLESITLGDTIGDSESKKP